ERIMLPELRAIDGVRDAELSGVREERVVITPDMAKLAMRGLSVASIGEALRANGTPVPAGALTEDGKSLTVQVGSRISDLDDLRDLYLTPSQPTAQQQQQQQLSGQPGRPQGPGASAGVRAPQGPVKLGDVATVERKPADATSLARTNGEPSLGVSVMMSPDGNAVAISHAVRDALPGLVRALGDSAPITVVFDQAPYVERSIEDLT